MLIGLFILVGCVPQEQSEENAATEAELEGLLDEELSAELEDQALVGEAAGASCYSRLNLANRQIRNLRAAVENCEQNVAECETPSEVIGVMFSGRTDTWLTRNNRYTVTLERIYNENGLQKADVLIGEERVVGLIADGDSRLFGGPDFRDPFGLISVHFMSGFTENNGARAHIVFKIREKVDLECERPPEVIGVHHSGQTEIWQVWNQEPIFYKMIAEEISMRDGRHTATVVINGDRLIGLSPTGDEIMFGGPNFNAPSGYISIHYMSGITVEDRANAYFVFKIRGE